MLFVWLSIMALLVAQQPPPLDSSGLSYDVYRTQIEPIFLKARAPDEGSGNACYLCHTRMATRMRLQPLPAGATTWTEDQSRQNFAVVSRLVNPADLMQSPLLRHPLAAEAGGDPQHTGGKFWKSRDNAEWQTVAEWARAASATAASAATVPIAPSLDFEFYRTRVEPILLAKRGEHARCIACHGAPLGLARIAPNATGWTQEQSQRNFENLKRLVVPGDPLASRLLMHPLASAAGGDPFHTGGKQWLSQDNPEWQTLAAWVRGQTAARP